MGAVGLVFAPLAPLVAVAAAIVLWIFSWAYKYQLMFVFISKVESGGVSTRTRPQSYQMSLTPHSIAGLECCHQSIAVFCPFDASSNDT
jgi:Calcium-dependent channel, 7TM region, putative phosphate